MCTWCNRIMIDYEARTCPEFDCEKLVLSLLCRTEVVTTHKNLLATCVT